MKGELEQRFKDFWKILGEKGVQLIRTVNGKTLEDLETENTKLRREVEDLKKKLESNSGGGITFERLQEIFGQENFDENGKHKWGTKTVYKLNSPNNEGLTPQELTDALEKLKEENQWKTKKYKPLTADILNKLLEDFLNKDAQKENLDGWLRGLGGYTIDEKPEREITVAEVKEIDGREELTGRQIKIKISGKQVEKKEEEWSKQERLDLSGTYKLAFVHDLIGFDLDDYRPNVDGTYNKGAFAKLDERGLGIDMDGKGVVPILTGGGKTTKDVCCIVNGGKSNVILICPNEALAGETYNHHSSWLQVNKCVIHGVHHGSYKVLKNDLTYYEDKTEATFDEETKTWKNVKKGGQKGLSILQAEKVLGYVARSSVKVGEIKEPTPAKIAEYKKEGVYNEDFEASKGEIKKRLITKEETIIIFDEAHFAKDPKYQDLQRRLLENNYNIIIMSATFPKKPFSITTSHHRDVYLVNQFEPEYLKDKEGNFLLDKDKNEIEKWQVQKTQIFLRTTESEWKLHERTGEKIEQTLWNGLTEKQKQLLDDNDIAYVPFDVTNQDAVTGITQRMPEGCLFLANSDHEMGFTPFIHNAILTGQTQLISLGKEGLPWVYDTPEVVPLSLSSMVQQIGRPARLFPGTAYLTTKELHDVDSSTGKLKVIKPPKDLSCKFVSALLAKTEESKRILVTLSNRGANMGTDPNFVRAAAALPYRFGMKPEEIFVGVQGIKPSYPTYGSGKVPGKGNMPLRVDDELWNRHLGNPTPPKVDKEASKQTMLIIIMDTLKKQDDITTKIDVSFSNSLIENAWGKEVIKEDKKTETLIGEDENKEAIKEVRKVLHTVFGGYRKALPGYKEGKIEYSESEKNTFDKLVNLYRVVNEVEIKIEVVPDKEKTKAVIKINYPVASADKWTLILEEEIGVWKCHRCLKVNNGYRFCEECGIDVRINEEEKEKNEVSEILEGRIEIPLK